MVSVVAKKLREQRTERGKLFVHFVRPFGYQSILEIRHNVLISLELVFS